MDTMTETSSGMDEHTEVKARIPWVSFYQNYGKLCFLYHEMQRVPACFSMSSNLIIHPRQTHAPGEQAFGIGH